MPLKKSPPSIASGLQPCLLTWYDPALGGTNSGSGAADPTAATASGEPYSATANTCAAPPAYAFGTLITFYYGGTAVTCKVNDRGGAITGTHFDLARAPATALGIIGVGRANGQFQVVSGKGDASPVADGNSQTPQNNASQSPVSGLSLSDLLTNPASTVGDFFAIVGLEMVKSIADGIADYIILPTWHFNQRAVAYYQQNILFDTSRAGVAMPATAAFWGLGYALLFTDPDSGNLKPAPVRNSRIGRHLRSAQAVPARRALIKPGDVKEKTPTKPTPHTSSAVVRTTGTMSTTRATPVRVTGTHVNTESRSTGSETGVPVERAGTVSAETAQANSTGQKDTKDGKSDTDNRTGASTRTDSSRDSEGHKTTGITSGN